MSKNYLTTATTVISQAIQSFDTNFTAKNLSVALQAAGYDFGLTTIYRHLDNLVKAGILGRTSTANTTISYWRIQPCANTNHFNLHCTTCGRIFHVDCEHIADFTNHIQRTHAFTIQQNTLLLNGTCANCQSEIL